ncbi:MAG: ubiquinol-cytochrome c reductase iron-sulfur subunit [Thermodesulfovibrionales bacterium]|nr:ubiquinol-cytochrome c reductase iron-sulfur subunit [Thermodesulfovibrionales bacterium]
MTRREVLKLFISYSISFLALLFIFFWFVIYPKNLEKKKIRYIHLLDEEDLPKRGVKKVDYHYEHNGKTYANRLFIVFLESNYIALSPVCTHLGCLVNWDSINKEFICPCHSGRYDLKGDVIAGPPIKPLRKMPIKIENEKVYVGIYL